MQTALVVDNSELMRTVIKDMLQESGVKTVGEARDVYEAITAYDKLKPDLVTLDIIMPGGSGIDVLRNIIQKDPKAKVLVITESGRDSVDRQVQNIGAKALLHKPLSTQRIQRALSQMRSNTTFFEENVQDNIARPKVLVVDDSMVIRSMVSNLVQECGMEVVGEASDVPPAIDAYQRLLPDIVVLDLVMPSGTGIDVLKNIIAQNLKTKVLIVTSIEQARLDKELIQMGAFDIVHKPFKPEELKNALRKAAAVQPTEPKNYADLGPKQIEALEALFHASSENCARAMNKLADGGWTIDKVQLRVCDDKEFSSIVDQIWNMKAIPVQIFVKNTILVIGLVLASKDTAEKLLRQVTHNQSAQIDEATLNSMLEEWTNILITAVLNVFANTMGYVILSSSPKILDWPVGDIASRITRELSDIPERILVHRTKFSNKTMGAECETMFFFRVDYAPKLIKP